MSLTPTPPRISRDLAARIMDRAAAIEAGEKVDLDALRASALDAGISPESFEQALREAGESTRGAEVTPGMQRTNAFEFASKALWIGAISGTLAMVIASLILGTPDEDALAGAAVGAGGALVGVFVHLLRTLRKPRR